MGAEGELLRRIQAALSRADLEADALVDEAWQAARAEVSAVLQRAFQHELLSRVADTVGDGPTTARPAEPSHAAPASEPGATEREAPPPPVPAAESAERDEADEAHEDAGIDDPPGAKPAPAGVATYVFGITRSGVTFDPDLPQVPGGGPVRAVAHDGLCAIVSDADPDALRELEELGPDDLDRLAAVAHAHDEVLARMAAQAPVVPLRLGTVLPGDDPVRTLLEANGEALIAELDRVEGHAEWAVVVRIPDGGTAEQDGATGAETGAETGSGYLRGRQADLAARERRWEARDRLANELHERLSTFAVAAEVVERRPLEQVPPALHGVYLLEWSAIGPFEDAVDDARQAYPEAVIEATGPWPPYHFTSVDLSLDDRGAP
jgi:hypothetical protein